jgi:hypothetical protein
VSEAQFVISHNFTTVRGDSYDQFIDNLQQIYGEEDGKSLAAIAFTDLRNHYLGVPSEREAAASLQAGLGAAPSPAAHAATYVSPPASSGGGWVALNIPFAQKDLAKTNGGKWDQDKKAWTFPPGHPLISQFPVK